MRKLLAAPLLLLLSLIPPVAAKTHRIRVHGKIVAKGSLASLLTLDVKAPNEDTAYKCVIETPEYRFRDFKIGDEVSVIGTAPEGFHSMRRCEVQSWTQTQP